MEMGGCDVRTEHLEASMSAVASAGEEGINLRKYDLNLLVALHALLRERSVTRAGELLGLSQSAMSSELRRLRQMFGDELLVRVGRQNHLTALARELVEPVDQIVTAIGQTISRRPSFEPATETRTFTISMSDYAAWALLHPLIQRIQEEAPGITLHIHPLHGPDARAALLMHGDVDVVVAPSGHLDGFPSRVLFKEHWVCAVWAQNPEVGDRLTLEAFERLPRLAPGWGAQLRTSWAETYLRHAGVGGRIQLTTESLVLAPSLLPGTRLLALVHERLVRQAACVSQLRIFEPPFPMPDLVEEMYWSPVTESDPAHAWLRDTLAGVARTL
jgi:DNA-binding transcriptional LysR family regulator